MISGIQFLRALIYLTFDLLALATILGFHSFGFFTDSTEWLFYLFVTISLLLLCKFVRNIVSEVCFLNLLMVTAQRGHIHTLRMLLLVRNDKRHEPRYLYDGNANFIFQLEKKGENGKSTVRYHHRFRAKRRSQKAACFSTWIFGDGGIPPEIEEVRINSQSLNNGGALPVPTCFSNHIDHEGIYKFDWVLKKGGKKQNLLKSDRIQFELTYRRKNVYAWDKDAIWVIHPRSFIDGINCASISVFVDHEDSKAISEVTITELSQGRRRMVRGPYKIEVQGNKEGMNFYSSQGELKIKEENVYIVTIHLR